MYEELLKTLRDFTPFSIIVSAVVIFVVFLCVFVIFSLNSCGGTKSAIT